MEFMGCDIPQHLANCRLEHDVSGNVTCQSHVPDMSVGTCLKKNHGLGKSSVSVKGC